MMDLPLTLGFVPLVFCRSAFFPVSCFTLS